MALCHLVRRQNLASMLPDCKDCSGAGSLKFEKLPQEENAECNASWRGREARRSRWRKKTKKKKTQRRPSAPLWASRVRRESAEKSAYGNCWKRSEDLCRCRNC